MTGNARSTTAAEETEVPLALQEMLMGHIKTQALYVAAKLGIADALSAAPLSSEALASKVGAHPGAFYKLLRGLENLGLVSEPEPGTFALTSLGAQLRTDAPGGFRDQVLMIMSDEMGWRMWGDLDYTITTGQPAFAHVAGMSMFDYLQQHPDKAATFNRVMARMVGTMAAALVKAYDFSAFPTIVDIGGGYGVLLTAILQANPHARGVLFDLPVAAEGARRQMEAAGLSERCACIGGDFFEEVPAGDVHIMLGVISDWSDEDSVRIFKNCRRSISPQGRLLLFERLLVPEQPASPMAFLDLTMLVMGGGTGRSEAEYRRLLADAGFELTRVIPTGTERSIFEARPV